VLQALRRMHLAAAGAGAWSMIPMLEREINHRLRAII